MDYRFGPNKPNFTGTDDEWNKLKQVIAWWNEDGTPGHSECDLMIDKKGKKIYYDCPGYSICRYINTPR